MRRKISLYIADQLVDLDDQSFILFNYTQEELSNPTIVRNSFTQSITIKGTPNNNKVFGNIYRGDRQTQYGDSFTGVNFDPARKTPFAIYADTGEILETGYMKLDKVTRKKGEVEYSITLYGGLGSFFYGLMYKEDGTKRTLADLDYIDKDGRLVNLFPISPDALSVRDAWTHLQGETSLYSTWNIINFAPCYNGIPENFDAKKALVLNRNVYVNVPLTATEDGVEYGVKSDASTRLMTFANDHSEWEVNDLRWYLQRPVISIKAIVEAICNTNNNGGYKVELDQGFFNDSNPYYSKAWMTLQMIAAEDRESTECINNLLKSTASPADVLISFAKVFGLVFLFDGADKKVSIMMRRTFYMNNVIDLTGRIHKYDVNINPIIADAMVYQFGDKTIGQFAEEYRQTYQQEYGIQKVITGYDFNMETTILTKGQIFTDAIDVMQFDRMHTSGGFTRYGNQAFAQNFLLPAYEEVSIQLWNGTGEDEKSIDVPMTATSKNYVFDNSNYDYGDWLPKVQLHKDNKPEDGSNVLLFFAGVKDAPAYNDYATKIYWLSNDHPDMNLLNQNVPCWNLTGEEIALTALPSFRRSLVASDGEVSYTWEWGVPLARAVPGVDGENTIYSKWWKTYLSDLYDDDTSRMTCKVNLKGLQVNQSLMRNFFWYDNAIWRLNKIVNHSLTTWDDTECEFVKVQDKSNYIE